ncbi:MSP (Major sperm protein) domain [Trypanosoma vivax]|nr:MSP (Major sperm protein) domain [Trypanosoma vivax]
MISCATSSLPVVFSQSLLYFPLPLPDAPIENVVEVRNTLPRTGDVAENVVAFKVLSAVRRRYGVRPSCGLIPPGGSVKIMFVLDVRQVRYRERRRDDGTRCSSSGTVPGVDADDELIVDVAVVPVDVVRGFVEGQRCETMRALVEVARHSAAVAKFWRARGQVGPGEHGAARQRLRCVYADGPAPEGLVVRTSRGAPKGDTDVNVAVAPFADGRCVGARVPASTTPAMPCTTGDAVGAALPSAACGGTAMTPCLGAWAQFRVPVPVCLLLVLLSLLCAAHECASAGFWLFAAW